MTLKQLLRGGTLTSILLLFSLVNGEDEKELLKFPPDFKFGAATSSYQIEGAWNSGGKGENSWDFYTHTQPDRIADKNNGDIACDSYNKYAEDAQLVKDLGMDYYRFSFSWARILPTGYSNFISKEGVQYYHKLLDELEKRNVTPMATIYHWDHPQLFQFMGGWTNEIMVEFFADFSRVLYKEFAHRIKLFITINEPTAVCRYSYLYGKHAPGLQLGTQAEYLCNQNLLKAHARAYHIYNDEFKAKHKGQVGMTIELRNYFPKTKNDTEAAEVAFQFQFGIFAHPIYSKDGDWPAVVKQRVDKNSKKEGLAHSRLPEFSQHWIEYIKGSADFMGLNHYTSMLVEFDSKGELTKDNDGVVIPAAPSPVKNAKDHGLRGSFDPAWPSTTFAWLKLVPEGFLNALLKVKNEYNNPIVLITENGMPDGGTLADNQRLQYLHGYMENMLIAMQKHQCNVQAYVIWSLLDNFEWAQGYNMKFGLYQVDFSSPNRTRTAKNSSRWLKEVIKTKKLLPIDDYVVPGAMETPVCDGVPEHCGANSIHLAPEAVDIYYHD